MKAGSVLKEAEEKFILHWGEMAGLWGINKTMGQVHALLYISGTALCADEVMERLRISWGSASTNLRGLADWGLIRKAHKPGDRKEYFVSETDPWQMFRTVLRERKKREFDPTRHTLEECLRMVEAMPEESEGAFCYRQRVESLLELLDVLNSAYERFARTDNEEATRLLRIEVQGLQ
ncbi:MAG: transcriptional regulator [Armatimonadetes bacterium]|nr:transcriptional regulator [Armatimonadota bacterium]